MYKDFMSEERKFSKKFLKLNGILEDRVNEDAYYIVEALYKDLEKIDKIYKINQFKETINSLMVNNLKLTILFLWYLALYNNTFHFSFLHKKV